MDSGLIAGVVAGDTLSRLHVSGDFERFFADASPAFAHCGKLLGFRRGRGWGGVIPSVRRRMRSSRLLYCLPMMFMLPAHVALLRSFSELESSANHGRLGSGPSSRMVGAHEVADNCDSLARRWGMLATLERAWNSSGPCRFWSSMGSTRRQFCRTRSIFLGCACFCSQNRGVNCSWLQAISRFKFHTNSNQLYLKARRIE